MFSNSPADAGQAQQLPPLTLVGVLICLAAAAVAPLVIPFTGAWLFFALHELFRPSVWGLPPLQSLIGVSINCTFVGYFFTWFFGLPLALVLRALNRYRLNYLLVASALPALSLPLWQADWTIAMLPVLLAGTSTAYAFWMLTVVGHRLEKMARDYADL
jgi:hypothetical protein